MPNIPAAHEKRALKITVGLACIVPIAAGAAGILFGPSMLEARAAASPDLDSHFRYLSGLLLGIGIAYATALPRIEHRRERFLLLGGIVVLGGLGRLFSMVSNGRPSPAMVAALGMELVITPGITLWQRRISQRATGEFPARRPPAVEPIPAPAHAPAGPTRPRA